MKQIIQTQNQNPKQSHRLILLDSCVFIEDKKLNGRILTSLSGKVGRYKLHLGIPRVVLYEVAKVTSTPTYKVLKRISHFFSEFVTMEESKEVLEEAKRLEAQFFEVHRPDSIILALARITGAILVTMDVKLRRSAILEGVETYSLNEFTNNWRVIA